LADDLPCVVRVIEALRLKGIAPGIAFTAAQALRLLSGVVGKRSLYAALNARTGRGERVFAPSPQTPLPCSAAEGLTPHPSNNAFERVQKRGINRRGRPTRYFLMPDNATLCALLGVRPSGSDPLTLPDLVSPKALREAMHRELVRRRPAAYRVGWHSRRLSVCRRTVQYYNRVIPGLHVAPSFRQTPLRWGNLNTIPDEESVVPGMCLEDDAGKRYPPIRGIALRLLKEGRGVKFVVQNPNTYWYADPNAPRPALPMQPPPPIMAAGWRLERAPAPPTNTTLPPPVPATSAVRLVYEHVPPKPSTGQGGKGGAPPPPKPPTQYKHPGFTPSGKPRKERQPRCWTPLANAALEALAERVYCAVNDRTAKREEGVSRATARRWVLRYGAALVERQLGLMLSRRNVYKPAGWLAAALRSEAKRG
jgi:hypothetical protein